MKGLYVITNEIKDASLTNLENIDKALKSGTDILQLRNKFAKDEELLELAFEIKKLCRKYNTIFIIDDRIELARKIDCDGVHIGKFDIKLKDAKEQLKNKIIGVSCYGNVNYAKMMEEQGANYVAFGSFFYSPTKPESNIVPLDTITKAKDALKIPLCAIGGININNAQHLLSRGADMISIISDIWQSDDIIQKVKNYKKIFEGN